jgi:hypothetical protein
MPAGLVAPPVARPSAPVPPAPPAPPAAAVPVSTPAAVAPPAESGERKTGPLRPVNPFMVQDPKQKARRLARALISDMLVYNPEKRVQAMREGTLTTLFKDEIEKSWLEYTEQVGQELAESTPFWKDALNDLLAGGQKLF